MLQARLQLAVDNLRLCVSRLLKELVIGEARAARQDGNSDRVQKRVGMLKHYARYMQVQHEVLQIPGCICEKNCKGGYTHHSAQLSASRRSMQRLCDLLSQTSTLHPRI